ncbi:MAG TPA: hypothetical protein VGL97_22100 [Bryobacteraceae bacterium]
MSTRYKVRMYESCNADGGIEPDTIMRPVDRSFSLYAESAEEVESKLKRDVQEKKLEGSRVYQICPQFGSAELIRSVSVSSDATLQRVFLDPAAGLYSEFRRIRRPAIAPSAVESAEPETVKA